MKRYILLFFALILSIPLLAQLEVKEGSFKEVPGFVNINTEKMYDDNDKPYAVLKIKTENISSKERHELNFKGDAQTFFEVEYKDGEVWLYISYYATYIKISHEEFSSTEFHFPFDMKPKCGYELTLVNKTSNNGQGAGSLTITTTPENGATIALNGKVLSQKTPYTNDMIAAGLYEITVSKYGFESVTKNIVINDGANTHLNIELPYLYVRINITSEPSEARVFIDDVFGGITPLSIDSIKYGAHELIVKKHNYILHKDSFEVNHNDSLSFNVLLNNCPDGAINGLFSVSEDKHVCFSKGNLQYHIRNSKWQFAENQWDYIGKKNEKFHYKGWIDLFKWGKGDNPTSHSSYYDNFIDYGINSIINGGNRPNLWRTLTDKEWNYIFMERKTTSGIRFAKAKVNGVGGMIILPDNWNNGIYELANTNNGDSSSSYNDNIISSDIWSTIFEANGAVFLPSAGQLYSYGPYGIEGFGYYQSSTPYYRNPDYKNYVVTFFSDAFFPSSYETHATGCSVRLVCDIE